MRWVEALQNIPEMGVKKGQRFRYPYQAAQALASRSKVMWVDGPHIRPPVIEQEDERAEPEIEEEDQGISAEDLLGGEAEEDGDLLSTDEFLSLDKADQKEIIREHGLEDKCDLRSSESMAKAYEQITN